MQCNQMNRAEKYATILRNLEQCSDDEMYYDMIVSTVRKISMVIT